MNAIVSARIVEIAKALRSVVGVANVTTDDPDRIALLSADFSEQPVVPAGLIVKPRQREEIPAVMRICNDAAVPVNVRGGGMSYTQAHVPREEGTLILDMSGLNRVVDLNVTDMHMTVETGITWQEIDRALDGSGLHLPFGGTFSGERATVGGGLGNNCSGHKAGQASDYLIGLEVVLADGRVLQTGGRATGRPVQALREYGPDVTGLFIHDAGAFGVKTLATFKLERRPGGTEFACFGFNDTDRLIEALVQLCRQGIATENAAFSEYHNKLLADQPKPTREEMAAMTKAVRHMAPTRRHAWRYLLSMARPGGLRFLADWKHSLSVVVDGPTPGIARKQIRAVNALIKSLGGKALPPTLPIVYRADPFQPVERLIVGVDERNCTFPTNRLTTLGNAHELYRVADEFFAENSDFMNANGLAHTIIFKCVHNDTFGIEPIIYWRDAMSPLRAHVVTSNRRAELLAIPENPESRHAALDLRHRLVQQLNTVPGAHYQIGKYYPYMDDLVNDDQREWMQTLKSFVDPGGILNPGGLGMNKGERQA